MNYPYGECVVFTDNQPLFSWIMGGIARVWPGEFPIIGIFNWLMLLGVVFGVYFMFLIFTFFRLEFWGVGGRVAAWSTVW